PSPTRSGPPATRRRSRTSWSARPPAASPSPAARSPATSPRSSTAPISRPTPVAASTSAPISGSGLEIRHFRRARGSARWRRNVVFQDLTPKLAREADLGEVAADAGVQQLGPRDRGDGVGGGGLARLRKPGAERGLAAVERARQAVRDLVGQRGARHDEAPR